MVKKKYDYYFFIQVLLFVFIYFIHSFYFDFFQKLLSTQLSGLPV